jgi:hypothetical protein
VHINILLYHLSFVSPFFGVEEAIYTHKLVPAKSSQQLIHLSMALPVPNLHMSKVAAGVMNSMEQSDQPINITSALEVMSPLAEQSAEDGTPDRGVDVAAAVLLFFQFTSSMPVRCHGLKTHSNIIKLFTVFSF